MERLHQEANPSLAPWKPPGISEHDASMPKSSRQMLLVEREVACGVLGHNYATLGRRPGQYLRIVQMSEVGRGRSRSASRSSRKRSSRSGGRPCRRYRAAEVIAAAAGP